MSRIILTPDAESCDPVHRQDHVLRDERVILSQVLLFDGQDLQQFLNRLHGAPLIEGIHLVQKVVILCNRWLSQQPLPLHHPPDIAYNCTQSGSPLSDAFVDGLWDRGCCRTAA